MHILPAGFEDSKEPFEGMEDLLTVSSGHPDPRVEWLYHQIAQLKDVDRSVPPLISRKHQLEALLKELDGQ